MPKAANGDTVKVHYTGKLEDGAIFDSSVGGEPLEFTIGKKDVIKGFEDGVIGLETGEKTTVTIQPEDAYGPYHDDYVYKIDQNKLPSDLDLIVGNGIKATNKDGSVLEMVIKKVDAKTVTLDANHQLAGKVLIFDIELIEIKSAIIT